MVPNNIRHQKYETENNRKRGCRICIGKSANCSSESLFLADDSIAIVMAVGSICILFLFRRSSFNPFDCRQVLPLGYGSDHLALSPLFIAVNRIVVPIVKTPASNLAFLPMPSDTCDYILLFRSNSLKRAQRDRSRVRMCQTFFLLGDSYRLCSIYLDELTTLVEEEFSLPYFEFVYDEHWDLGHGWSGDM